MLPHLGGVAPARGVLMSVPSSVAKPALSVTVLMNVPWNVVKSVLSVSLAAAVTVPLYVPSSIAGLALSFTMLMHVPWRSYVLLHLVRPSRFNHRTGVPS